MRKSLIVAIVAAVAVAAGLLIADALTRSPRHPAPTVTSQPTPPPDLSTPSPVVYAVDGTADSVFVTVQSATGTEQAAGRALPIRLEYTIRSGQFVYISAQNEGDWGDVTCEISIGDRVISRNSATGAYTIATCQGVVP